MAKSVTPVIGLAVVVALAMVAVFGAMSLTNPAFAAVGQSADSQSAERDFSPQEDEAADIEVVVYVGDDDVDVNLIPFLNGREGDFITMEVSDILTAQATVTTVTNFGVIGLNIEPGSTAGTDDGSVVVIFSSGNPILLSLSIELKAPTGVLVKDDAIPTINVPVGEGNVVGPLFDINVAQYFEDGRGTDSDITDVTAYTPVLTGIGGADTNQVTVTTYTSTEDNFGKVGLQAAIGADVGDAFWLDVTAVEDAAAADPEKRLLVALGAADTAPTGDVPGAPAGLPSFMQSSDSPGSSANYTVEFKLTKAVNTRRNDLVIEFHDDYGMPATMRNTSVAITTMVMLYNDAGTPELEDRKVTFTPEDVTVDGQKVLISVGDIDERDDMSEYDFSGDETITVHFRQSAGITNPTEAKGYNLAAIEFGGTEVKYDDGTKADLPNLETTIIRKVSLSEGDGGLDTAVTGTGKGFKDKTSLTVFLDKAIMVYYDEDENDSTDMVRLPVGMAKAYNAMVKEADGKHAGIGNVPVIYLDDNDMPCPTRRLRKTVLLGITLRLPTAYWTKTRMSCAWSLPSAPKI